MNVDIEIQDLILLETIERLGSFSAAADFLLRTRSAITQHIKKLENQVGFQIFDRSQYRPSFTPKGRLLLERSRLLLRNLERLKSDIQQIKQGWESEFSIAFDDVLAIENVFFLIEEFRKVAPSVTFHVHREVLNGCWEALLENRAMLVIGVTGEPPLPLLCEHRFLGAVDFVFAVAKDHPLTHIQGPILSEDLKAFPAVTIPDTSQSILRRSSGIIVGQPRITVPTMEAKITAQVMGLGVGYLPRPRIQSLLNEGCLVELSISDRAQKKALFNVAWQANSNSPTLEWFLKALESKQVREQLLGISGS